MTEAKIGLVLDCADPGALASFWTQALGMEILGEAEVAHLEAIGAKRLEDAELFEHNCRWVVMADPEGNEFCVCHGGVNAGG